MTSTLCDLCQSFNIRELLLLSAQQEPNSVKYQLTGNVNADIAYRQGIPKFFKYHPTLAALKAAHPSCVLCKTIWELWSASPQAGSNADEWLDKTGQGQIYIGTSGSNVTKLESPSITISQRPLNESPRILCNFEVFATDLDASPRSECAYVGGAVAHSSLSTECERKAKRWFGDCIGGHSDCGPVRIIKASNNPTRVIDVGIDSSSVPFLDMTPKTHQIEWAALSYCWGGNSPFVLTKERAQKLVSGIELAVFPATLRDAIVITRQLGLRYLWVDALCIFQDSKEEWAKDAGRLRDVYAGSAVTIVASVSPSTDFGIFQDRIFPQSQEIPCQLPWGDQNEHVFLRPSSQILRKNAYSSVLHTRGWTLQEGMLASRTITYGKDQMVWECSKHRLDESGHTMILEHQYDSKDLFYSKARRSNSFGIKWAFRELWARSFVLAIEMRNQVARCGKFSVQFWNSGGLTSWGVRLEKDFLGVDPYYRWGEIVLEFSKRHLTNDMDLFPALSGIAQEMSLLTRDTYCAGMWKCDILKSLCWTIAPQFTKKKILEQTRTNYDLRKPSSYRAPSWSWASICGGKVDMFPGFGILPLQNMAAIIDIHIEPSGPDPFGQISKAHLIMKAPIFQLGDLWKGHWANDPGFHEGFTGPTEFDSSIDVPWPYLHAYAQTRINSLTGAFEFEQQHITHPEQHFILAMLLHDEGREVRGDVLKGEAAFLILESTGQEDNEYRRVGQVGVAREQVMMSVEADLLASAGKNKSREEVYAESMKRIKETRPTELVAAGAWLEISSRTPKATTIRIV